MDVGQFKIWEMFLSSVENFRFGRKFEVRVKVFKFTVRFG